MKKFTFKAKGHDGKGHKFTCDGTLDVEDAAQAHDVATQCVKHTFGALAIITSVSVKESK